jgi:hypothetical protein
MASLRFDWVSFMTVPIHNPHSAQAFHHKDAKAPPASWDKDLQGADQDGAMQEVLNALSCGGKRF